MYFVCVFKKCLLVVTNTNWRDKKKVWDYAL